MVAALELYLDTDATRRIRTLWRALDAEGIPSLGSLHQRHRPHISLAAAHKIDAEAAAQALDDLRPSAPLTVEMDFVGQFVGRVLWLGVTATAELLTHHRDVHDRLTREGIDVWDHYRPGRWVPHCTISLRVPNPMIAPAIRRCLEMLPLRAEITGAAIADHANDIWKPLQMYA
ncbi:2'-5' RNA ligase family protein [Actinoplanes sp. DH11]|uniref:2'-5' RNA ligase family protein n=1 Tax=Actinoplanes sp. DH11 TaxID=2857011 RepID=UPI001E3EC76E|nr:2'-5' RNA ligase family protein [Actinoplanes sp. DH11]